MSLKEASDLEDCEDEAARRTAAWIDRLKALHRAALRLSPAALYARIMDEYCLYRTVPAENLEVVCYALELIRNAQRAGLVVSPKDGASYIRGLIAGESGEERCLSLTADRDCVHMANLHKVKGLEAPIVILAAAGDSTFSGSCRMIHGDHGSEGYVFSLESERDESGRSRTCFSTSDYPDEQAAENEALKAEGQRLVYVAATRARNVLILCNSVSIRSGKEKENSKWGAIMEPELPDIFEIAGDGTGSAEHGGEEAGAERGGEEAGAVRGREEVGAAQGGEEAGAVRAGEGADAAGLYEAARQTSVLNDRSAEAATFRLENPSRTHVLSKLSEFSGADETEAALEADESAAALQSEAKETLKAGRTEAGETEGSLKAGRTEAGETEETVKAGAAGGRAFAALLGTMTHRLMEMLVMTRNTVDVNAAVLEMIREYRTPGMEGYENRLTETLLNVAKRIRDGGYVQTNGLPQDILGTLLAADEVCCEVPFSYRDEADETTVWNGAMDVIYCVNGRWHIVDYKTNADGSDLDTRYRAQLSAYVNAFRATTGLEADALTYHIDIR